MRNAILIALLGIAACKAKHTDPSIGSPAAVDPQAPNTAAVDPTGPQPVGNPTVPPAQAAPAPADIAPGAAATPADMAGGAGSASPSAPAPAPRIASPDAGVDGPDSNGLVP